MLCSLIGADAVVVYFVRSHFTATIAATLCMSISSDLEV